jgi:hypothetical protein
MITTLLPGLVISFLVTLSAKEGESGRSLNKETLEGRRSPRTATLDITSCARECLSLAVRVEGGDEQKLIWATHAAPAADLFNQRAASNGAYSPSSETTVRWCAQ